MAASMWMSRLARCSNAICHFTVKQSPIYVTRHLHTVNASRGVGHGVLAPAASRLLLSSCVRPMSTQEASENTDSDDYHSIIKNTERGTGPSASHEFQAETKKLLDIVARSLYSDKEVFIRELISNSSDALEKKRYVQMSGETVDADKGLEIHIATDETKKTFVIQDTGMGMTKEELIENLGTIARSGSKAFLDEVEDSNSVSKNIIGQFGVGFYSAFMVSDKIDVYTKSSKPDSVGYKWTSEGQGSYEITEAENVDAGSKIVLHLKGECYDYAKEDIIKGVVQKYSNFISTPIYLNGKRINVLEALWTKNAQETTEEDHEEFYKFISQTYDSPRYTLQYKTDAPLNLSALFYVPGYKPTFFEMSRETDVAVTLYSRKVMIMSKANHVLPKWLRFMKGVVDSEDIPLNLSRELLQDSALIRKLNQVLTNRIIKFFNDKCKKHREDYMKFYDDYSIFFKEGIVTTGDVDQKEQISKLMLFESSNLEPGQRTTLDEYATRMKAGERNIYYIASPSRALAESSPYFEAMKEKNVEVLFVYEAHDEVILMNLAQFDKKYLKSIENVMTEDTPKEEKKKPVEGPTLSEEESQDLCSWLQVTLGKPDLKVKETDRLSNHPCMITVPEMGAARHFLKTALTDKSEEEKMKVLQPTLEINASHPMILKLNQLKVEDPDLARMLGEQIFNNAMVTAGLNEDPRSMVAQLNDLLTMIAKKL